MRVEGGVGMLRSKTWWAVFFAAALIFTGGATAQESAGEGEGGAGAGSSSSSGPEASSEVGKVEKKKDLLKMSKEIEQNDREYQAKVLAQRKKNLDERLAMLKAAATEAKQKNKELQDRFAARLTGTVTVDGKEYKVVQPHSPEEVIGKKMVHDLYEISPHDFKLLKYERWSLNKSDFQFDDPVYVTAETRPGHAKTWFGFTFSVTNSTASPRLIMPIFTAVTENGAFNTAVGGFLPERIMADSRFRPLADTPRKQLRDKILAKEGRSPLEPAWRQAFFTITGGKSFSPRRTATFTPGEVRYGAALWSQFSNEFTKLKIVVHGLCNSHRFDRNQRRVLVLTFKRNDDEFHVHRVPLVYVGKKWEWLWMWDKEISVPLPPDPNTPRLDVAELDRPAGGKKQIWSFPYTLKNSTPLTQSLVIKKIRHELGGPDHTGLEATVGGQKVKIVVRVVDDGRSTIYKAQYLRLKGLYDPVRSRNRFLPEQAATDPSPFKVNNRYKLLPGVKLPEQYAVFDIDDVDWNDVYEQAEAQLTAATDKQALAAAQHKKLSAKAKELGRPAGKMPVYAYDPRRRLTDSEKKDLRKQLLAAIPRALETAKAQKTITAEFTAASGLSSGTYRITRSWRIPGEIKKEWLDAWKGINITPIH